MLTSRFPEPSSYQSAARKLPMPTSSTSGFVGSYTPPLSTRFPSTSRRFYCCPRSPPSSTMSLSEAPSSTVLAIVSTTVATPSPPPAAHVSITHRRLQQTMTSSSGVQLTSFSKTSTFTTFLPQSDNNCNHDGSSSSSSCDVTSTQTDSFDVHQSHLSVVSQPSFVQSQHPPLIPTPLSPPPPPPPPMPSFIHHSYTIASSSKPPASTIVSQEQFLRQVEASSSSSSQTFPTSYPSSTSARIASIASTLSQTVPPPSMLCFNGDIKISTSETANAVGLPPVPPPPPPPPPPGLSLTTSCSTPTLTSSSSFPRSKTRRLQWQKLSANRVLQAGRPNVWTHVVQRLQKEMTSGFTAQATRTAGDHVDGLETHHPVDFEALERMFSIDLSPSSPRSASADSAGGDTPPGGQDRKRLADQVDVLDNRRSLNINIFLRQFRSSTSYDELIAHIATADSEKIGAERLRALVKSLPDDEEMNRVVNYIGDPTRLGLAERFCRDLASLSHYRLRIDALLMKEEFNQTIDYLKPMIDAVIITAKELQQCQALRDILYTVLLIGNFLNAGGHAGNATGFRLQSLSDLGGIRANGGRLSLLHLIVSEVEKHNRNIAVELQNMKFVKEAAQFSVDSIAADISSLKQKLKSISTQLTNTDSSFQRQMDGFLEFACEEMSELESDITALESLRRQLADYFCEDERTFKLDDCIKLFAKFFESFIKASQENQERSMLEEKAEERRRQRAELMNAKHLSQHEANTRILKKRSDPMENSSVTLTTERSPTSGRQPRDFDGRLSRRGSRKVGGSDDTSETTDCDGSDCNDLLDILSRGDIVNYASDSLTRRKRRPRTAEVSVTDSSMALTSDHRERTASPSPRSARASPSREIDRYGDGLVRRGSLPPAPPPVADEVGRPSSSGQRRPRRSVDYRHASLHTVDREHSIRPARHIDYQQLPQSCTNGEDDNVTSASSVVVVPDDGAVVSCNGDSFPVVTGTPQIESVVDDWPNRGARSSVVTLPVNSQTTITASGIHGNGLNQADDNADVCVSRTSVTKSNDELAFSGTLPVRRKSCLKNSRFIDERFDEPEDCPGDLPRPVGTGLTSSTPGHGISLFRQSSLDGTRSSSSRIENEAHMIDAAVLEFQTRQVPEREALKNRLRKLTQIYSTSMVPKDESGEVKTWPPRTPSVSRSSIGYVGDFEDMTENSAGNFVRLEQSSFGNRGDSLKSKTIARSDTVKSDSESLSSQRDEGFESASLSSDLNLSSSQRSSMCDYDSPIVVTPLDVVGHRDLDEDIYNVGVSGIGCVIDNSRDSSQESETGSNPGIGLGGMREAESRNSVENYFARSSIDSLVTLTAQETVNCVEFDDVMLPRMSPPHLENQSGSDGRGSGSSSDVVGEGRSSSERRSPSVTMSTKVAKTSSTASRLKPKIPVRMSSTTSVTGARWSTAPQPKAIKYSPMESMPSSRRQSVDSNAASSTIARPIRPSTTTRPRLFTGNPSRVIRKQNARAVESPQPLTQGANRKSSVENFVRSSIPRTAISAPTLRANKQAAAEARKLSGRTTTKASPSGTGQLQQQCNTQVAHAGLLSLGTASGAEGEIAVSKSASKLPSRTQVNKATVSRIQPPGGSRIPPPSKPQLR